MPHFDPRPDGRSPKGNTVNDLSIRLTRRTNFGDKTHEETIDLDLGKLIAAPAPVRITNVSTLDVDAIAARMAGQHAHAQDTIEWSPTLCDGKRVNFADAEKACSALGEGWRLPTRMELESILDLTRHDPAVDTTRFPDTKSGWYWSSTPCAWSSVNAWIVGFNDGVANNGRRDGSDAFVRAVRGVPAGQ
jgi:hypothetical protein